MDLVRAWPPTTLACFKARSGFDEECEAEMAPGFFFIHFPMIDGEFQSLVSSELKIG